MAGTPTIAEPVIDWSAPARRGIFHLKTDPPLTDDMLRGLRARAERDATERTAVVEKLAAEAGLPGKAELCAVGTYHVVHRLLRADAPPLIVRSAVGGLFTEDRSLLMDGWARAWLGARGQEPLVPRTMTVRFESDGAPFDFSVMDEARGVLLQDEMLDEDPAILREIGAALRAVHDIAGDAAGLLDLSSRTAPASPQGVHARWSDFIMLNLDAHVATCRAAGLVDAALADKIAALFRSMHRAFQDRPMRLLHGDPGTHNIAMDRAGGKMTALLDWEDALVGDPLFDVAMWSTFHPPRRWPGFMAGYGLETPSDDVQRLIAAYFLRIALSKTVHRFRFGITDRPGRTPGHQRIHRGVEELERLLR
jgi:aminoglycoside phosphotransferase (APT) family kinase protein